jgi:hypothetical protein
MGYREGTTVLEGIKHSRRNFLKFAQVAEVMLFSRNEHLFYNKYFPIATIHAMKVDICKFTQRKEDTIPQAWGGLVR